MYSSCRHSLRCTKYRVCECYELSMSINMVQCSLHKLKKGQQTCHNVSLPSSNTTILISSRDPTGVCHVVLIAYWTSICIQIHAHVTLSM